jgi:hypothetical protein
MKYIKKYNEGIDFSKKDAAIIIVGMPSGEVLEIKYEQLDVLYDEYLVHYTSYKNTTGFYSFDDKNIEKILNIINPNKSKKLKNLLINDNKFEKNIIDKVIEIIENCPFYIQLMVEDYNMYISFGDVTLDISYNDISSPKYLFIIGINGKMISKYSVPTDELFIRCVNREIYKNREND